MCHNINKLHQTLFQYFFKGPRAESLMKSSMDKGGWVFFQVIDSLAYLEKCMFLKRLSITDKFTIKFINECNFIV